MKKVFRLFADFLTYLASKTEREVARLLIVLALIVALLAGAISWYIYTQSSNLVTSIQQLYGLKATTNDLVGRFNILKEREENLIKTLESRKDFSIKTYFEQFFRANNLTPEGNWSDTERVAIPGSDKFEEERLQASFKGLTMERVVRLLETLERETAIEIKEISLRAEGPLITMNLAIAAKRFK